MTGPVRRPRRARAIAALVALTLLPLTVTAGPAHAAAGDLDLTFDTDGRVVTGIRSGEEDVLSAVARQSDGKWVAAGTLFNGRASNAVVARYTSAGAEDTTFAADTSAATPKGHVIVRFGTDSAAFTDVAMQSDGKIVAAGWAKTDETWSFAVARLNADGTLDSTFDGDGKKLISFTSGFARANAVTVLSGDVIVVAGEARVDHGDGLVSTDFAVVRLTSAGALDTTFGTTGIVTNDIGLASAALNAFSDDVAHDIVPVGTRLALIGSAVDGTARRDVAVAMYESTGALSTSFGGGIVTLDIDAEDWAMAGGLDVDGIENATFGLYVGGRTSAVGAASDFFVARFLLNGTPDESFGTTGTRRVDFGADDEGWALVVDDRRPVVVGSTVAAGTRRFAVARLTPDGSLDTTFDGDGRKTGAPSTLPAIARAAALGDAGSLLVAGHVGHPGDIRVALGMLDTRGVIESAFGTDGWSVQSLGSRADTLYDIALQADGRIVAVGETFNGTDRDIAVARFDTDGSPDETFNFSEDQLNLGQVTKDIEGRIDNARGVAIDPDGRIVVAGSTFAAGVNRLLVLRFDPDGRLDPTFNSTGYRTLLAGAWDQYMAVTTQSDGKIVAAGSATTTEGKLLLVSRFNADGTLDTTFDGDGHALTSISGNDLAVKVLVQPDGAIVATGSSSEEGIHQIAVVRYTPAGALDPTFDGDGKAVAAITGKHLLIQGMALQSDGKIVVAGAVQGTTVGSNADVLVARFTATGALDTSFGTAGMVTTPVGTSGERALDVAVQPNGKIVAVGNVSNGTSLDTLIVRYTSGGTLDASFGNAGVKQLNIGADNDSASAVALQTDGQVVVGGTKRDVADSTGLHADTDFVLLRLDGDPIAPLTLLVDRSTVPASPASVPFSELQEQLQPTAPGSQVGSPVFSPSIVGSPILSPSIVGSPILSPSIVGSPILSPSIVGSPILSPSIVGSPILLEAFDDILLSSLTIEGGWEAILGTGIPVQSMTLKDLVLLDPRPAALDAVRWSDLGLSGSPLGTVSVLSLALGTTRLRDISLPAGDPGWCSRLEGLGHVDCGAALGGLDSNLFVLQLAGVSLDSFPLAALLVRHVNLVAAQMLDIELAQIETVLDLQTSPFGSVLVSELANPDAVVNCASTCGSMNIADAADAGHLLPTATIRALGTETAGRWDAVPSLRDLGLLGVVFSLMPASAVPLEDIPLAQLALDTYVGPATSLLQYTLGYRRDGDASVGALVASVTLPPTFRYLPGSATLQMPAGSSALADPTIEGSTLTWSLSEVFLEPGQQLLVSFAARPGLTLGTFRASAAITGADLALSVEERAPVTVTDPFEPNDTAEGAPELDSDSVYLTYVHQSVPSAPTDMDLYQVAVPAVRRTGARLRVTLSHLSHDADLVVYYPAGTVAGSPLHATQTDLTINGSPIFSPSIVGSPIGDAVAGAAGGTTADTQPLNEVPLLPGRVVAGVSANRSLMPEVVEVLLPADVTAEDRFTVQVAGFNGSGAPQASMLRTEFIDGPVLAQCAPVAKPHAGEGVAEATPTSIATDRRTIILWSPKRLGDVYGAAAVTQLRTALTDPAFAEHAEVKAALVSVDTDAAVSQALAERDADQCSADTANKAVGTMTALVDRLLTPSHTHLKAITVLGGDPILPMARIADLTLLVNERDYRPELGFTTKLGNDVRSNALEAAAAQGFILSDEPLGDFNPMPMPGGFVYLADVAVTRLPESPATMTGMVNRLVATNASLNPMTMFTAGYDFSTDLAKRVDQNLGALIDPARRKLLDDDLWERQNVVEEFTQNKNTATGAPNAPDIVNVHGHYDHRRALPAKGNTTGQFTEQDLFTSQDVDGGVSLLDAVLISMSCHAGLNVPDVLLAGVLPTTDQQLGVRDWPQAYLEKGTAFYAAPTAFSYGDRDVVGYTERIVDLFTQKLAAGIPVGQALVAAKNEYIAEKGQLSVYDIKVVSSMSLYGLASLRVAGTAATSLSSPPPAPAADPVTGLRAAPFAASFTASDALVEKTGPRGRWFQVGTEQPEVDPHMPLTARKDIDVSRSDALALDAVVTGATFETEIAGFDPVLSRPIVDNSANEPELQLADVIFPAVPQSVGAFMTPEGVRQNLVLMATRFRSTGLENGQVRGSLRKYSSLAGEVYYAPFNVSDRIRPTFRSVDASVSGTGPYRLQVTARIADETPGDTTDTKKVIVLYRDGLELKSFALAQTLGSDDWSGAVEGISNRNVEFIVQAVDAVGNVGISDNKATWHGDSSPPVIRIASPVNGAVVALNDVVLAQYSCSDAGSGVATCAGDIANGAPLDTSTPGEKTLTVTATDLAGNIATVSRTYVVRYLFSGFREPLVAAGEWNKAKGGQTIPLKFDLTDANGASITTLTKADFALVWREIDCATRALVGDGATAVVVRSKEIVYDSTAKHFVLLIDTPKAQFAGSCRRLFMTPPDGIARTADFIFR